MNFYSGIGHYTDTVMDWLKYKADGKEGYNIILAARLSGTPHIGTLVNFMVGYKLAFELSTQYHKKVKIAIELLDNISDEKINDMIYYNNKAYYYKQLVSNSVVLQKRYYEFYRMISRLNELCNVTVEVKTYQDIQQDKQMRNAISEVLVHRNYFSKIFNPRNERLHIRIACPKCGLIEKNCTDINVEQYSDDEFCISSICPVHGLFHVFFSSHNQEYIDINIPFRHFCKGLSLLDADKRNNHLSIQVLGNDWSGGWPIRMFCEGAIYLKREQLPTILFSPLVIKDGIKISKSNIFDEKNQEKILDINKLTMQQLHIIWNEIERWFQSSNLFFDNYNSKYFERILCK